MWLLCFVIEEDWFILKGWFSLIEDWFILEGCFLIKENWFVCKRWFLIEEDWFRLKRWLLIEEGWFILKGWLLIEGRVLWKSVDEGWLQWILKTSISMENVLNNKYRLKRSPEVSEDWPE